MIITVLSAEHHFRLKNTRNSKKLYFVTFPSWFNDATRNLILLFLLTLNTLVFSQERLVGLTSSGGPNGGGTAFSILNNGTGFSIATAFSGYGGNAPYGDLTKGNDGNLYGM